MVSGTTPDQTAALSAGEVRAQARRGPGSASRGPSARPGHPPRRGTRARRRRERGVALILVITTIAILTAVAVDFQYNATVDLQMAANGRDELRAEYLARSAVNMSRLLLRFQRQLDASSGALGPVMSQLGMGGGGSLNIRLWELVPIDCALFQMLLAGSTRPAERASGAPAFGEGDSDEEGLALKGQMPTAQSFGDFQGCFRADLQDEEQKINVNRLNMGAISGQPPMLQALALLADPRFEFIYEKADANGVKMTPQDVLVALHDWADPKDTQATLNMTGTGDPFPDGFGDENRYYTSSYGHRFRAKNASFDTLDELYQVDGVSDLFMAAFRDRLTVYADKNRPLNINTNDPLQQRINIYSVAKDPNDPKLHNEAVIGGILQQIAIAKLAMPFMGMSTQSFLGIVKGNGIALRPEIEQNAARWISDKSETFTIKATGQAGNVERSVTAVVRANDGIGKLLYFRLD